jgi:hypothetical protein
MLPQKAITFSGPSSCETRDFHLLLVFYSLIINIRFFLTGSCSSNIAALCPSLLIKMDTNDVALPTNGNIISKPYLNDLGVLVTKGEKDWQSTVDQDVAAETVAAMSAGKTYPSLIFQTDH